MLDAKNISLKDKTLVVSGSGNVATYAIEKAQSYGAKVVTCSDSNGYIYDPAGIDLAAVKEIKQDPSWSYQRVRSYPSAG
jgi:glutamate dehydrogenase (NADP+)